MGTVLHFRTIRLQSRGFKQFNTKRGAHPAQWPPLSPLLSSDSLRPSRAPTAISPPRLTGRTPPHPAHTPNPH